MLRGLVQLTWLEIKIFLREPLGVIGTLIVPFAAFVLVTRLLGPEVLRGRPDVPRFASVDLTVFAALLVAINAVMSLVTIIAIYREGGILKRLRATPLRPATILVAHVVVKLLMTAVMVAALLLAGRRYFPAGAGTLGVSFVLALLFSTVSVLSLGFVIASVVPTARFAQPIAWLVLYPMLGLSGLFVPLEALPAALRAVARALPLTYAVSLLRGIWHGEGWISHAGDVLVLVLMFFAFTFLSGRVFRWE
jgi:ABC-2 type transport system permease protein